MALNVKGLIHKLTLNLKRWLFQEDANTIDMSGATMTTQTTTIQAMK
jgi:hypothetical protein